VLWQQLQDRGCYFNKHRSRQPIYCDPYEGTYEGGRKNASLYSSSNNHRHKEPATKRKNKKPDKNTPKKKQVP
jgi:hypothetical protein